TLQTGAKGVPVWFKKLDTDKDGQVSLAEWRKGGKKKADFRKHDLNGDGFITAAEILRTAKKDNQLELENGRAEYKGNIEFSHKEAYQNRMAFKIFLIKLEQGKTYQIEMISPVFFAYLFLEGPGGSILAQHNSGGFGKTSRIIYRAGKTGIYR